MTHGSRIILPMTSLMNVRFSHTTLKSAVNAVAKRIAERRYSEPLTVFTPNTEQLIQATESAAFLKVLNVADVTVPDTVGLVSADWWRAARTGSPWMIRERVAGIDLAENLLATAAKQGWKVAMMGGITNTASLAVATLKNRFEGLQAWAVEAGVVTNNFQNPNSKVQIGKINEIEPDILFVGLGAPKQEYWVLENRGLLKTQVVMVVGGAIDVWSGRFLRAPHWMRSIGLEWLWRLGAEPSRWKRQVRLIKFIWLVLLGKI